MASEVLQPPSKFGRTVPHRTVLYRTSEKETIFSFSSNTSENSNIIIRHHEK